MFENLPDTLIAPSDGPAPTLTADVLEGYEATDYYLPQTYSPDSTLADAMKGWAQYYPGAPGWPGLLKS